MQRNELSKESLLHKHKNEQKELQAKIQRLKKSFSNKDKKGKKEAQDQIEKLKKELDEKHAEELRHFIEQNDSVNLSVEVQSMNINGDGGSVVEDSVAEGLTQEKKMSKAQRRREKKSDAAKERALMLEKAEAENEFSSRNVEIEKIKNLLGQKKLKMHEITPDGNCLFAAVAHQLNDESSVNSLRSDTAAFIKKHSDDFIPFLTHPETGDLLNSSQFERYCKELETTSAWGGQPELRALSQLLQRRIEVIQANGAPVTFGDELPPESKITLAYYRHYYGLGEHYNSTVPTKAS